MRRNGKPIARLTSRCRQCCRANYKENPARAKDRAKAYYHAHREDYAKRGRERRSRLPSLSLFRSARRRARELGLEFDLTVDDIPVPALCPVLGIPLVVGTGKPQDGSPTLDRINNQLGYVRGNVLVVSYKANTIKSNANVEELARVADFYWLLARKPDRWNGACKCGHLHDEHGPSGSINFTAGRCLVQSCRCRHFIHDVAAIKRPPPEEMPMSESLPKAGRVVYPLDRNFTYHPPKGTQQERYERLREEAKKLANDMLHDCPDSRERSLALTSLEQAVMWANAAIARNE